MLYRPQTAPASTASISKPLTGRFLSHNNLPARQRALLAGDLVVGKAHLANPTLVQAALLARVSIPYAAAGKAVVFGQPHLRMSVESGERPLLAAAGRASQVVTVERAVASWRVWTPEQRVAFGRSAGIADLWDHAISPAISEERASLQAAE